jgi:hypothetical protein
MEPLRFNQKQSRSTILAIRHSRRREVMPDMRILRFSCD